MPTPRADSYSIASGADLYAGIDGPPAFLPPVGQWGALADSTLSSSGAGWSGDEPDASATSNYVTVVTAWSGGVLNTVGIYRSGSFVPGTFLVLFGGGHGDYAGNELYAFGPLNAGTPIWSRIIDPTIPAPVNVARDGSGYPVSRHTYDTLVYLPSTNEMLAAGAPGYFSLGFSIGAADVFDFGVEPSGANPWQAVDTNFPAYGGGGTINGLKAHDPLLRRAWVIGQGNATKIGYFDEAARQWGGTTTINNPQGPSNSSAAMDSESKVMCFLANGAAGSSPGDVIAVDLRATPSLYNPATTGTGPGAACALTWDNAGGRFVAWPGSGATVYFLTPGADPYSGGDAWVWTSATPGAGDTPASQVANGTYGRFQAVDCEHWRGLVLMPAHNAPVYVYRMT